MTDQDKNSIVDVGGAGGGKGGGGQAHVAIEVPDSLRSTATIEVLEALCEGEIWGFAGASIRDSIFLDGTPLKTGDTNNFTGVSIVYTKGTQDQAALPGFGDPGFPASEHEVSQRVKYNSPITRTIAGPDVDYCRVTISLPRLFEQNKTNGDVTNAMAQIAIQVRGNDGQYQTVDLKGRGVFNGKTSSMYMRSFRFGLRQFGDAPYEIRVSREVADSNSLALSNETHWASYTEITSGKFTYPNTALVRLSIDAQQLNSVPVRGYLIKGLIVRVPNNYNPTTRVYTGEWTGAFKMAWTNNPAWVFYDMLSDERYGLGKEIPLELRDKWTLYQIAQYCDGLVHDGMGGWEPRFTCNLYMQTAGDAYRVMRDLASIFRGVIYWGGGGVLTATDQVKSVTAQFVPANVIDGRFTYTGTERDARYTVALVAWNNPDNQYKREIEYVEDPTGIERYGYIEADVTAVGCQSRGQAHRAGKALLLTSRLETDSVVFSVGLDGIVVLPGQVIRVVDPNRSVSVYGGRITDAPSVSAVKLDRDVELLAGKTYKISLFTDSGALYEKTVTNAAGTVVAGTNLTFTGPLPAIPLDYSVWTLRDDAGVDAKYRVVGVQENAEGSSEGFYQITAVEYVESKYALIDSKAQLEYRPPKPSGAIQPPSALVIADGLYAAPDKMHRYIDVSWAPSPGPYLGGYRVRYTPPSGGTTDTSVLDQNYRVLDPTPGRHQFTIYAVDIAGRLSTGISGEITLDVLAPIDQISVTGLELRGRGNSTEFVGPNADFVWRVTSMFGSFELGNEPLGADSGSNDPWFRDYEVRIYAPGSPPNTYRRIEHVTSARYIYSLDKNVEDGGGTPTREFYISVAVRDVYNRTSKATTLKVNNPAPIDFGAIQITQGFESIYVEYQKPPDADYVTTRLYLSTVQGFTPGPATLVNTSNDLLIHAGGLTGDVYYLRLEGVDSFGPAGVYTSEFMVEMQSATRVLNQLAGQITQSQLHQDLLTSIADGSGTNTFYQPTAPVNASQGDLWFDTDDSNHPYVRNNNAWADARDSSVTGVTTHFSTTAPTTFSVGDLWFDTDDSNHPYRRGTTSWQSIRDGYIASAVAAEASVRQTADGVLNAQYTIKVDVNGHVAGMGLAVVGGASGPVSSKIVMLADQFGIGLPVSTWKPNQAYTQGQYVKPTAASIAARGNPGKVYVKSNLGTGSSGAVEPLWPVPGVLNGVIVDSQSTWTTVAIEETVPFTIGSVGGVPKVVIGSAMIADASIDSAKILYANITDAHIVNLTAAKITGGTITTTDAIYLGGNKFVMSAGSQNIRVFDAQPVPQERVILGKLGPNATDYGIIIKGVTGNTILSSGGGIDNSGLNLGAFAFVDKITELNIGTYMDSFAVGSAYIAEGAIDNAKISGNIYSTNFVQGSTGWRIQKDTGAAEFNAITIRNAAVVNGTLSACNGNFSGTVYAANIEGDVYDRIITTRGRPATSVVEIPYVLNWLMTPQYIDIERLKINPETFARTAVVEGLAVWAGVQGGAVVNVQIGPGFYIRVLRGNFDAANTLIATFGPFNTIAEIFGDDLWEGTSTVGSFKIPKYLFTVPASATYEIKTQFYRPAGGWGYGEEYLHISRGNGTRDVSTFKQATGNFQWVL